AVVVEARARGIEVVGELELAWRLLPGPQFVAVTGTNGKTTTTELLGAIHRAAGIDVAVAGNVGTALSEIAVSGADPAVVVCECSSFQLEDAPEFAPDCGVLLNLGEDHLDRHGDVEAYRAAKLSMFEDQSEDDVAVLPVGLEAPGSAARVTFGHGGDLDAVDGQLRWRGDVLMPAADVRIRGAHNLENAMAAAAAALARGVDGSAVRNALREFAGVPHRLEEVGDRGGVLFVNDSKATNVGAAAVGMAAFDSGVHVILGGSLKGGGFRGLREAISAHCVAAYLIGEAADELERDLEGTVPLVRSDTLDAALGAAATAAEPGQVVLLSPACASYDQFTDYEERGDRFRDLVGELDG
ncbi:MAG: UDP-N-acetylmuramoylalanine--D-glutamate ligase, partial [Thermoleophilaceae bacterium]|nr:UDP-N-acetylmuramoylalanine--D-glutamate ligase [Thermoleophilaceae bacterium]